MLDYYNRYFAERKAKLSRINSNMLLLFHIEGTLRKVNNLIICIQIEGKSISMHKSRHILNWFRSVVCINCACLVRGLREFSLKASVCIHYVFDLVSFLSFLR